MEWSVLALRVPVSVCAGLALSGIVYSLHSVNLVLMML
jgi:hypothetical protein